MPTIKIPPESALYFEIKAKYEAESCNIGELAKEYGVGRPYLTMYAKKHQWERGKTKTIYDATKLVEMDKVLNEFKSKPEKIANKVITKQAQKEGAKKAELILQSENYKLEIANKLAEAGMKYLDKFIDALDNIKNGKVVDTEVEGVIIDDNGKPANVIKKTTVLRPKEFEKIVNLMQAFGILQTTPTVAIQNNNTTTQEVKVHTEAETNKKFGELLQDNHFQNFVKTKNP